MSAPVTALQLAQRACDQWNARYPAGTDVIVRLENDDLLETKTASKAYMANHAPVIIVFGLSGCVVLDERVDPLRAARPRMLDLFCGAGGASAGYHRGGFDVTGVDISPQPRYPFRFIQADALQPPLDLRRFDFIHASPPCQRYTMAQNAAKNRMAHPDLVAPVREMLIASGVPWVMENVVGAPLNNPVVLCGLAFGLMVKRHRLIESSRLLLVPPCPSHDQEYYVIFGHEVRSRRHGHAAGRKNRIAEGRAAMQIDWMTRGELSEAIPPAYSEFIARQFLAGASR